MIDTNHELDGINGIGNGTLDQNAPDFLRLKETIRQRSEQRTEAERMQAALYATRCQMILYVEEDTTEEIKSVGYFLENLLRELRVSKKDFAAYIGYEYSNLIALMKGRRKLNHRLAVQFGSIFNINPLLWMRVEMKNALLRENVDQWKQVSLKGLLQQAS